MKVLIIFSFFLFASVKLSAQKNNDDWNSMVAAEYSFAKSATEIGTRDAFLKFIADDGILFRPTPVNGRKFLTDSPGRPGLLSWFPVCAKVSINGRMGFTTGPADFKKDKDSAAIWFGNFATVWERQSDGEWKFVIDYGNSCNEQNLSPLEYSNVLPERKNEHKANNQASPDELFMIDNEFNRNEKNSNYVMIYMQYINEESRLLRDGHYPVIGIEKIAGYLREHKGIIKLIPLGGKISSSKDIGFTYGRIEQVNSNNTEARYNYFRIYKKDGTRWLIAVEVVGRIEN
ncbi:MAG: hypothetical protein CVV24_07655 [Ignavibacteriae bacterium HGW-Ignavibacteriae-3]|nr:MAG: hypothetical protein CVV24_07655 [Ignavibacteriae bacterium HGW-Ignavibacteriae-3]